MKSLKRKAHLAQELSLSDWLVLNEAWVTLLFFRIALYRMSYQRLTSGITLATSRATEPLHAGEAAQRIQRLTRFAARLHFPAMTCLPQALALRWMSNRRGIPAQAHIGVRKDINFHAHAWVEVKGELVGEPENISARFSILKESGPNSLESA